MSRFASYYARFHAARGDLTGLPPWARTVFLAVAVPGILLVALSILALAASVVALLFLAVPAYLLLRTVTQARADDQTALVQDPDPWRRPAKHVDVSVHDPDLNAPDEVIGE